MYNVAKSSPTSYIPLALHHHANFLLVCEWLSSQQVRNARGMNTSRDGTLHNLLNGMSLVSACLDALRPS